MRAAGRAPRLPVADTAARVLVEALGAGHAQYDLDVARALRRIPALGERLGAAAVHHRVPGHVRRHLRRLGVNGPFVDVLSEACFVFGAMHLRALADLRVLATALEADGAPFLVFKGPALSKLAYADDLPRAYTDLDVLVRAADFPTVLRALERHEGVVVDRNWRKLHREEAGAVHVRMPNGSMVDLHWSLVNEARDRHAYDLPQFDDLARDARPVDLGGIDVLTFGPADTLLHAALHATRSGIDRLVWLKDLERLVHRDAVDWEDVARRAHAWRVGPAAAFSLAAARRILHADVPPTVLVELAGSRSWLVAAEAATRLAEPSRARGDGSIRRLVARSARASAHESFAELGRRAVGWLRSRGDGEWRRRWLDPTDAWSPLYPAGRRDEYLEDLPRAAGR